MNITKTFPSSSAANNESEKIIKINDLKTKILILLNSTETALKLKNVRIIINDTYQLGMAEIFWTIIIENSVNMCNNHISTWKLCQLIHQVLNKGSPLCCYYGSQKCINYLLNIVTKYQNYSGDRYDNYGTCIIKYINLLVIKLKFHSKNQKLPTNLSISKEMFDGNFGEDYERLFQLAVEIFDYLDGIIDLQNSIFTTNLTYSIAPIMECRFMALLTLIEESKLLYFTVVQIMHNLHIHFPLETLNGHRNRFVNIFKDIKIFYDRTIKLNLLQNITWIPKMTENPPEFYSNIETTNSKHIVHTKSTINSHEKHQPPYNNINELNNDENLYYDSDFDSSTDDDDDAENPRQKFYRQNTLTGDTTEQQNTPSAPSLDTILQDKEEIIRNLKHLIEILEQKLLMKSFEVSELKSELKNIKIQTKNVENEERKTSRTGIIENGYKTTNSTTYSSYYDTSNPFNSNFKFKNSSLIGHQPNGQARFAQNSLPKEEFTSKIKTNYPNISTKPLLPKPNSNNISRFVGIGTSSTLTKNLSDYQRSKSVNNLNYGTVPRTVSNQNVNILDNGRSVHFSEIKKFWSNNSTMIRKREN